MKFMRLQLSCLFVQFFGVQTSVILDSSNVCHSEVTASQCDPSLDDIHNWEEIQLNCSIQNALTITYSNYRGLPPVYPVNRFSHRTIAEVRLKCILQDGRHVNCSDTATHVPNYTDVFTFSNLNEAGILPGSTCFVTGCYANEVIQSSTLYVRTPEKNCTIQGIPTTGIIPTTVLTATPTTVLSTTLIAALTTGVPIKENPSTVTVTPTMITSKDPMNDMDSHTDIVMIKSLIPVLTLILLILLLSSIILSYTCVRQQRARVARKTLLVLDGNMVFDPYYAPPISIDKPSFSYSHRISVVSAEFIQNLRPEDRKVQLTLESSSAEVITKAGGAPPPYNSVIHNSIKQISGIHLDGSNELPENNTDHLLLEQPIQLPATSLDHVEDTHSPAGDSTSQLTEDQSFNYVRNEVSQDDGLDGQSDIMSDDNQRASVGDAIINLDGDDHASSTSYSSYVQSNFTHAPLSNASPTLPLSDGVELDLFSLENEQYNSNSLPPSQSFVPHECITESHSDSQPIGLQNMHQQHNTHFTTSMDDNLHPQPICSPILTLDDDLESDTLNLRDTDGYLPNWQPSSMNTTATHLQDNESLELDLLIDCHDNSFSSEALQHTNLPSAPSNGDDITSPSTSDNESVLFLKETSDSQNANYLEQQHQNGIDTPHTDGYLRNGSNCTEGTIQIHPVVSNRANPPLHSFGVNYEPIELNIPNSDSSAYLSEIDQVHTASDPNMYIVNA